MIKKAPITDEESGTVWDGENWVETDHPHRYKVYPIYDGFYCIYDVPQEFYFSVLPYDEIGPYGEIDHAVDVYHPLTFEKARKFPVTKEILEAEFLALRHVFGIFLIDDQRVLRDALTGFNKAIRAGIPVRPFSYVLWRYRKPKMSFSEFIDHWKEWYYEDIVE